MIEYPKSSTLFVVVEIPHQSNYILEEKKIIKIIKLGVQLNFINKIKIKTKTK